MASTAAAARGYARMADRGLSQRAIAKHTGISQGQIAKRLSLLKLIPEAQAALEQDHLVVGEALEWAKEHDRVQRMALEALLTAAGTYQYDPASALQTAHRQVTLEGRRAAAEAKATELGMAVHEPPVAGWQGQARPVDTPEEIEAAKQRGDLFVKPGQYQDDPELVTTYRAEPERVSDYEQRQKSAESRRKQAMKAREECLRKVARKMPSTREVTEAILQMTLAGGGLGGTVTTRARKLAAHAKIGPQADSDWEWRDQLAVPTSSRGHLAWLIYLAWLEDLARLPHQPWGTTQVYYVKLLTKIGGYVPAQWEQQHLTEAQQVAQRAEGQGR